ncbi:unnamed protein product [Adineta ricciae]|uniref:Uncharacterized protein n=1 Tax=Adineta ricciae TaxID=249248 RepID=A0A816AWB3_ADIRI|nr:unnamed protein product [Adineta ricciae]
MQKFSVIILFVGFYLFGLPLAYVFTYVIHMNIYGFWLGIIIAEIIMNTALFILVWFFNWETFSQTAMKRFQRDDTMALPEDSALLSKRLLKPSADENLQLLPRQCTEENDEEGVADGASQSSSHAAIPQSSVFELIRVKLTILIDNDKISLRQICFIWASFGGLLLISSFLFLDWKFTFLNLSYQFDRKQDKITTRNPESSEIINNGKKWYKRIYKRLGSWEYLSSPLYIMIVLFLSTLFITTDLLAITWYPMNYDLYNHDASLGNIY